MKYILFILSLVLFACVSDNNEQTEEVQDSPELEQQELQKVKEMLKRDQEILDSMMNQIRNDSNPEDQS